MVSAVAILVIVLVLAGVAAYFLWGSPGLAERYLQRKSNGKRLQRKYGREYDRVYATHGDHAAVERELDRRERDRRALAIVPVGPKERDRLTAEWTSAQAGFVDDPGRAARRAEQLIGETLAVRGYPADNPERQLALASVDHAHNLSEFRDGHELLQRSNSGAPGVDATEQRRQAMLRFRVFFDELVGGRPKAVAVVKDGEKVPA